MIATLLAFQDTVVEALPPETAAAAAQATAETVHSGINYIDLMLKASLPVKLIVLLLLAGSLISWIIIFRKARVFKTANRDAAATEARLTDARYRNGIDSFLDSLLAQRSLFAARQQQAGTVLETLLNRVTLYRVLGGDQLAPQRAEVTP